MPQVIRITNTQDARLRLYRNVKDRDLKGREGAFMAEGQVVLERLFTCDYCETLSILTTETRLARLDIRGLADTVPIYVVEQALMDEVAGFDVHRGYLALGRYRPVTIDLSGSSVRVMALSGIANVDNMGGLLRNAAAFGVDLVVLDHTCCDPLYRKAIRVSVGGIFSVPHIRLTKNQSLIAWLRSHDICPYALSPHGDMSLAELRPQARCAFVFGTEGAGLEPDILAACQSVRIDMFGGFDSLNVATTAGIVLYKARL
jgi:tRNA G18 (ribose-2'-O)-methylase SpoU